MGFKKSTEEKKPDLNKDGSPRKHGEMITVTTRLHPVVLEKVDSLAADVGTNRSGMIRNLVNYMVRDCSSDGSFKLMLSAREKKVAKKLSMDGDTSEISHELHELKTALNKIGNLLNQDVKIRNTYIKHLDETHNSEVRVAYENERMKILNKYNKLMNDQEKLRNASRDLSEREVYNKNINVLKAKREEEISWLDARYSGSDYEEEKNMISAGIGYDEKLKEMIEGSVNQITDMMEEISNGICEAESE